MAFVCQEKNIPIDRRNETIEKLFRLCAGFLDKRFIASDLRFQRGRQSITRAGKNGLNALHQTSIKINCIAKSSLTISVPLFSGLRTCFETLIPAKSKGGGLPAFDRHPVMHHSGKGQNKSVTWSETRILNRYRQASPIQ